MSCSARIAKENIHGKIYYKIRLPKKIRVELGINNKKQKFKIVHNKTNQYFRLIKDNFGSFELNNYGILYFNSNLSVFDRYLHRIVKFTLLNTDIIMSYKKNSADENINKNINNRKWSEKIIYNELLEFKSQGKLYSTNVNNDNPHLYNTIYRYFESWGNCLDYFGLQENDTKRRRFKDNIQIINEINKIHNKGYRLSYGNMIHRYPKLYRRAMKIFGSWANAVNASGIDYYNDIITDSSLYINSGLEFEFVLGEILQELGVNFNKYQHEYLRPDFVMRNECWLDAKLSEWTVFSSETIEKYEPQCKLLTIVFLRGSKQYDKMITSKTRMISVYKLIRQLRKDKQIYFKERLIAIEKRIEDSEIKDNKTSTLKPYSNASKTKPSIVKLLNGKFVEKYNNASEARMSIGGNAINQNIIRCCKGERNTAYGYEWMYKEDYEKYIAEKQVI